MTGFFNALSASLVLLMLMSVGYFMGVLGWMTAQEKKFVSKYIVNIAVPCNCLAGLLNNLDRTMLAEAAMMLLTICIDLLESDVVKEALSQYRNICQLLVWFGWGEV